MKIALICKRLPWVLNKNSFGYPNQRGPQLHQSLKTSLKLSLILRLRGSSSVIVLGSDADFEEMPVRRVGFKYNLIM